MLTSFTVYGERCSGTNFLEKAIEENFYLELTWDYDFKHWFGNYEFENNVKEAQTLFLGIIRNPINWLDSFYKVLHYLPISNKKNIKNFLFNECYSFDETKNKEINIDKNLLTKKKYKNIFELRYIKNNYLIREIPKKVKNYLLLRYEDLNDNYDLILSFIEKKFNLRRKHKDFKKIINYKGENDNILFKKKNITLDQKTIYQIIENLNKNQENELGYDL